MPNDQDSGADPERSGHCRKGNHERCPHWGGFSTSLRLLRVEFNRVLCRCDCHDTCPLHGRRRVTDAEWSAQCTCPGSVEARHSRTSTIPADIDLRQIHRRGKDERQRREDIDRTVFDEVGGADRAVVRSRLLEELARRGVAVPPPPLVELRVDAIMARGDVVARGRMAVEGWTAAAGITVHGLRNAVDLARMAKSRLATDPEQAPDDQETVDDVPDEATGGADAHPRQQRLKTDRTRWVEVNLDRDASAELAAAPPAGGFKFRTASYVRIVLWRVTGPTSPVHVDLSADTRIPIGLLEDEAGAEFADVLTDTERTGAELTSLGLRWKDPGGDWHLYLFLPRESAALS